MKCSKPNNYAANIEDCNNFESSCPIITFICEVGECVDDWDKYRDNEFCCEEKYKDSYCAYNPIDALKV